MKIPQHLAAQPLLRLASMAYGGVVRLRNRVYDRPAALQRASIRVLSVGNLTVGGTGKTPVVAWLTSWLCNAGRRTAVVSRGYGGHAGRRPLVVSVGAGPLCHVRECGDEPWLLARDLPGVLVVVGSDRWAAAQEAARLGADVAVLDDGFQHRQLSRDLDIVLLDSSDPFGGGRLLPHGLLREPLRSLERAGVVVVTRCGPHDSLAGIESSVRRFNTQAPLLRAGHEVLGFVDASGRAVPAPRRAVAFCAIGSPRRFKDDLERTGVELVAFLSHRDHHRYSAAQLTRLHRLALEQDCALVTTEKDLVRIGAAQAAQPSPPIALRIAAVVHEPEPLLTAVAQALGGSRR